jgi:hypothetical protein
MIKNTLFVWVLISKVNLLVRCFVIYRVFFPGFLDYSITNTQDLLLPILRFMSDWNLNLEIKLRSYYHLVYSSKFLPLYASFELKAQFFSRCSEVEWNSSYIDDVISVDKCTTYTSCMPSRESHVRATTSQHDHDWLP